MEILRTLNIPRSMFLSIVFHALVFCVLGLAIEKEYENLEANLIPKGILLEMGSTQMGSLSKNSNGTVSNIVKKQEPVTSKYYHQQNSPHPEIKKEKANYLSEGTTGSTVGNSLAGHHGNGQVGDPNGREASISEHYLYELKLVIEQNKIYPKPARMAGHEGKVTVAFTILKDGSITDIKLLEACPFSKLNEAAVKLIENIKTFKAIPEELGRDSWSLNVPIQYSLN